VKNLLHRKCQQHSLLAHSSSNFPDRFFHRQRLSRWVAVADMVEVANQSKSANRTLWMELDAVELLFVVGDRRTGVLSVCASTKPAGNKVHESPWLIHMVVPSSTLVSKSLGSSITMTSPPLSLYYLPTQLPHHIAYHSRHPESGCPSAKLGIAVRAPSS